MPDAQVITVTGPRDAATLGVIDAHDHLLIDSPGMPGTGFTDVERSIEEARDGLASGISTLVEMTPIGLGRDPAGLRAISEATGLAIVAASGFHRDAALPRRFVGPRGVRGAAVRPHRHGPHGRHAPARLARPVAAARRGPGGRDQGWCVLSPHQPLRAAPARGDRGRIRGDGRGDPRPHRDRDGGPRDRRPAGGRRRDDGPDRPRPPRSQPGLGAPRRGRGARRHARVRHRRPDEVPPRQRRPRPDRAGRGLPATSTGSCLAWTSGRGATSGPTTAGPGCAT